MSHVYVLALTGRPSAPLTVDGHRVEFINVENLYAVIERRAQPPVVSESELRAQHDIVIELFKQVEDLLPVRFGAWLDRDELSDVLQRQRAAIAEALELVDGRVQMTVRFRHAAPGTSTDQRSPAGTESGTTYLRSRQQALRSVPNDVAALNAAVNQFVSATRASAGSDGSPSSLYHLIGRDRVAQYTAAVQPFLSSTTIVTGPWPPFAFAPDPWL
jgi:gas vesicle protein GvpL/GvpF